MKHGVYTSASTVTWVNVDQTTNGGVFNLIGTFQFNDIAHASIVISSEGVAATTFVGADAIKFELVASSEPSFSNLNLHINNIHFLFQHPLAECLLTLALTAAPSPHALAARATSAMSPMAHPVTASLHPSVRCVTSSIPVLTNQSSLLLSVAPTCGTHAYLCPVPDDRAISGCSGCCCNFGYYPQAGSCECTATAPPTTTPIPTPTPINIHGCKVSFLLFFIEDCIFSFQSSGRVLGVCLQRCSCPIEEFWEMG